MICARHGSLRFLCAVLLCLVVSAGCGDAAPGETPDAATPGDDGGPPVDAASDRGTTDAAPPPPTELAPCERASCWENPPPLSGACGTRSVPENFSTEKYNVHRYDLAAPGGVAVELTLEVTAGSWNPALLVLTGDGATLYDGERGTTDGAVRTETLASGRDGAAARVRVTADADTPLHVFVTSWSVVDGDFVPPMPADASYKLSAFADCPAGSAVCPLDPADITHFGSGYFTTPDSPYKRDTRDSHSGYDLHAPLGVPVFATEAGTIVASVTTDTTDCGRSINLSADTGVTFRYCHLDKVLVTGGRVAAGQQIAENGETGNAHSPHVHFVYLDAPDVTGAGTSDQKSEKVNAYIDGLCR